MVCILYISCSHCHVSVDETQRRMWYVYYTSVVATVMYVSVDETQRRMWYVYYTSVVATVMYVSVDETQRRMWYVYYTSVVATVMSLWMRHREECGMYTIHQL